MIQGSPGNAVNAMSASACLARLLQLAGAGNVCDRISQIDQNVALICAGTDLPVHEGADGHANFRTYVECSEDGLIAA